MVRGKAKNGCLSDIIETMVDVDCRESYGRAIIINKRKMKQIEKDNPLYYSVDEVWRRIAHLNRTFEWAINDSNKKFENKN
jgi:hypothetical protein